jgi:hypothetical protein
MQQPNVVLAPRNIYEDIKHKRIQPHVLFYAALGIENPAITPQEMEQNYGAPKDIIMYLFDDSDPWEFEMDGHDEPEEAEETETVQTFADQAEAIITKLTGRDPNFRPDQWDELEQKTGGDLGVVQGLSEMIANSEGTNDPVKNIRAFMFALLNKYGPDKFRRRDKPKSKIAGIVEKTLADLAPPADTQERDNQRRKERLQMAREKGLIGY